MRDYSTQVVSRGLLSLSHRNTYVPVNCFLDKTQVRGAVSLPYECLGDDRMTGTWV